MISALHLLLPEIKDMPLNTIPLAKQVLIAEEIKITETLIEDLVI
jgi:amidase